MEEREFILKTLILSFTLVLSISITIYSILMWGNSIGLNRNLLVTKVLVAALVGIHFLFLVIFIGNLVEFLGRKVGVFSILFMFAIELIFIYLLGIDKDPSMFGGSVAFIFLAFLYTVISS